LSNYPDLDGRLFNLFFFAVSGEVSNFAASETCFIVITLLAFFLGETILSLSSGFLVLRFVLYFAGHDGVSILVKPAALPFYVGYVGSEVLLLIVPFPQPVINACS
jgi:hypothetical protein